MSNDVRHLFTYSLTIWKCSLIKYLFKSFVYFKKQVIFLLLIYSSLYILYTTPVRHTYEYLLPMYCLPFCSLTVIFTWLEVLNFDVDLFGLLGNGFCDLIKKSLSTPKPWGHSMVGFFFSSFKDLPSSFIVCCEVRVKVDFFTWVSDYSSTVFQSRGTLFLYLFINIQ